MAAMAGRLQAVHTPVAVPERQADTPAAAQGVRIPTGAAAARNQVPHTRGHTPAVRLPIPAAAPTAAALRGAVLPTEEERPEAAPAAEEDDY